MSRYKIRRVTRDKFIEILLFGNSFWIKETKEGAKYKAILRTEFYNGAHIDRRSLERKDLIKFGFSEESLGGVNNFLALVDYEDRLADCYGCTIFSRTLKDFVEGTAKIYYRNRELRLIDL